MCKGEASAVLGLIGVGTIGAAVVRGVLRASPETRVVVGPRNAEKAAALKKEFPAAVEIAQDNQQVVDAAQVLLIGVHHRIAEEVIAPLRLRAEQTVACLFVGDVAPAMERLVASGACEENVAFVTPLPACAKGQGVAIVYPPGRAAVTQMFAPLGSVVEAETEEELMRLRAGTCVMGDLYRRMELVQDWLVRGGVKPSAASTFVGGAFMSMVVDARDLSATSSSAFRELVEEQTPGGLNERVISEQEKKGAYKSYVESLDDLVG